MQVGKGATPCDKQRVQPQPTARATPSKEHESMSLVDAYGYNGKRALVVGGATGMGAATAELVKSAGAEGVLMDRAPGTPHGVKSTQGGLADNAPLEAGPAECGRPPAP